MKGNAVKTMVVVTGVLRRVVFARIRNRGGFGIHLAVEGHVLVDAPFEGAVMDDGAGVCFRMWELPVAMVAAQRQTDVSLRRAAILLSNLDAENRRRLLAHFPNAQAARLRAAAASLADVDPLEVRRIVDAFVGRISIEQTRLGAVQGGSSKGNPNSAAELARNGDLGGAAGAGGLRGEQTSGDVDGSGTAKTLQFLSQVSDRTLLRVVQAEHPQTVAIVLGALTSQQAAKLLRELPREIRTAAIRRLGRLDEVPEDVLNEIAEQLRKVVGEIEPVAGHNGHKSLTSILSLLDEDERQDLLGDAANDDLLLAAAMREVERSSNREASQADEADVQQEDSESASTLPFPAAGKRGDRAVDSVEKQSSRALAEDGPDVRNEYFSRETMQQIDVTLESLKPKELKVLLAKMETRQAILTLCGLSSGQVKRLMKALPRRQVREVEQRMSGIGALKLWEIDQAKVAAVELLTGTKISTNDSPVALGIRRAA